MCAAPNACAAGTERCCAATATGCDGAAGGVRACEDRYVPAKPPTILSVVSNTPFSFDLQWTPGVYVSGFVAPCSGAAGATSDFLHWSVQIAQADASGALLESWSNVTACEYAKRGSTVCTIDGRRTNTYYHVRIRELCQASHLNSDFTITTGTPPRTQPLPALQPADLRLVNLNTDSIRVQWTAPAPGADCTFQNWRVEWRQLQQLGASGSAGTSWSVATDCSLLPRASLACNIAGLQMNTAYEVRVMETCQDPVANSPWLETAPFRWSSNAQWEVYMGPSASTTSALDILGTPQTIDVIAQASLSAPTLSADGIFTLCVGSQRPQVVALTRTDVLGGWTQQLWLRCGSTPRAVAPGATGAARPALVHLVNPTLVPAGVAFNVGFDVGADLGTAGCRCAQLDIDFQAVEYGPSATGIVPTAWGPSPVGSCATVGWDTRSCLASSMIPDALYTARMRILCEDTNLHSTFTQANASIVTAPGCKWLSDSGADDVLECINGTFCSTSDEACCSAGGGRARCPRNLPVMCEQQDCVSGTDHCCRENITACSPHGGPKVCTMQEIPAKAPQIVSVSSSSAGSLTVSWRRGIYRSGAHSSCFFRRWSVELAVSDLTSGAILGPWTLATVCTVLSLDEPICEVSGLSTNTGYKVRIREKCSRTKFDSDAAVLVTAVATRPLPARAPMELLCATGTRGPAGRMVQQISWQSSHANDCTFRSWELDYQLQARAQPPAAGSSTWVSACRVGSRQDVSCQASGLLSDRDYLWRAREVCNDAFADSTFNMTSCLSGSLPADPVENLTATPSPYSISISWDASHPWACLFSSWQVQVKLQSEASWEASGMQCNSTIRSATTCTVEVGLGSLSNYHVRVKETCLDTSHNSAWAELPHPGVRTTAPQRAGQPSNLAAHLSSAFQLELSWTAGSQGDCVFTYWEAQLGKLDNTGTVNAWRSTTPICSAIRHPGSCSVNLRDQGLAQDGNNDDAGIYRLQFRERCTDMNAASSWLSVSAVELLPGYAAASNIRASDAGWSWIVMTWDRVSTQAQCSTPSWRVQWRARSDGLPTGNWSADYVCNTSVCNVTDLVSNRPYDMRVEESCFSQSRSQEATLGALAFGATPFWTMPGEWSTVIGTSSSMTAHVPLTETPHRCYVQKECCGDQYFICHSGFEGRNVMITRSDVPGGWGQTLRLQCVSPALAGISNRPLTQALGPAFLELRSENTRRVQVRYPTKLASNMEGCECPNIALELREVAKFDGQAPANTWVQHTGYQDQCVAWSSRLCTAEGLTPGSTYQGRVRIGCQNVALNSTWTISGNNVTTNLPAGVVAGAIAVVEAPNSNTASNNSNNSNSSSGSRRLLTSGDGLASSLRTQLGIVANLPASAVLVTPAAVSQSSGGAMLFDFVLAASRVGPGLNASAAHGSAETMAAELKERLASDFGSLLSGALGSSVRAQAVFGPSAQIREEAFSSCGTPPSVANSAWDWTGTPCLGRTWSDPPCPVPCDTGFLPEGGGYFCGVDGRWYGEQRCASIWRVSYWEPCLGVAGDCGPGGRQQRKVTCPLGAGGCHSASRPREEQSCRATAGCTWVIGSWTACSSGCGQGERLRNVSCSSDLDADCLKDRPAERETCFDFSDCQWDVSSWSACSSSCGAGTKVRNVSCPAGDAFRCPSYVPHTVNLCLDYSGCSWQVSAWSECPVVCGTATATRDVWCETARDADCQAAARPPSTMTCKNTAGCAWLTGPWSGCSSSCGPGQRNRFTSCPSGEAADCPVPAPAITQDCYAISDCGWQVKPWGACDASCGDGSRSRSVACSGPGGDTDCALAGARPRTVEVCRSTAGCSWQVGTWGNCSSDCGPGLRSRTVLCPSGKPLDCGPTNATPASSEPCRGQSACGWGTSTWSQCSNDCGDGAEARTVFCSSGLESDCLVTRARPENSRNCRETAGCGWSISAWTACNSTCGPGFQSRSALCSSPTQADCPSPGPAVLQHCYATSECSWLVGTWSSCSNTCGAGSRQRSVSCSSGSAGDCAGERPASSEACYATASCAWQISAWSDCSVSCGQGLRLREATCPSGVDADCGASPAKSEVCRNISACYWHKGNWSSCSSSCGYGNQTRSIACSSGQAADCPKPGPISARQCFDNSTCTWQVTGWEPCNASCGTGWQVRNATCPTGQAEDCPAGAGRPAQLRACRNVAGCSWIQKPWSQCSSSCEPGTRSREVICSSINPSDCSHIARPADREICGSDASGCKWQIGSWSSCSATACGSTGTRVRTLSCPSARGEAGCPVPRPNVVETCRAESTCKWIVSDWAACDAACGSGERVRNVYCTGMTEDKCAGPKPHTKEECYTLDSCSWWLGEWSACNSTCGHGVHTREVRCGASQGCDTSNAPSSTRPCYSKSLCVWSTGPWQPCSNDCGTGIETRLSSHCKLVHSDMLANGFLVGSMGASDPNSSPR
eukprot:TRINITY_DN13066_c0_g1_i2.p1 TRINITY_DN13066_c0_g1~~TRINITY_DN13066_c0_g1_i2.p1  ORF type:complete len:2717 (+),score=246.04 TRINITY_DN13066_c0_g1_i2:840-8153(+)